MGWDADRICAYCNLKMILLTQRASRTAARKTSEKGVHCSEAARDGKAVPRSSPRACVAARLKGRQRRALARGAHQSALGDDGSGARAKLEEAARWQALARVAQNELGAWCRSPAINFVAGHRLLDSLAFTGGFDIANPRPQWR